jgi:hypothetical protein
MIITGGPSAESCRVNPASADQRNAERAEILWMTTFQKAE